MSRISPVPQDRGARPPAVLLGIDVGASSTRVVLARSDGRIVARGTGPGANRYSSATPLGEALSDALAVAFAAAPQDAAPEDVRGVVVAVAGVSHGDDVSAEVERSLVTAGIGAPLRVVPDFVANHAAGSRPSDGLVLVAGTGAVAARIVDRRDVARADGAGWLLGDGGSAVWLGLEAIRATLRSWDGRAPATALEGPVIRELLGPTATIARGAGSAVVAAVSHRAPATLGALAPAVLALAPQDAVAATIVHRAADELAVSAIAAAGEDEPGHLVVAGSVLLGAPTLRAAVLERLQARWPAVTVHHGRDGAAGAVVIALEEWHAPSLTARVHDRLVAGSPASD